MAKFPGFSIVSYMFYLSSTKYCDKSYFNRGKGRMTKPKKSKVLKIHKPIIAF